MQSYLDPRSGRTWPLDLPRWCGDAREPLLLTERRGIGRDEIAAGTRSIWRYAAALPFVPRAPITMGEGCSPLVERALPGGTALLKCEWFMPTGSFKDRGASVMLSLLRDQGVASVLEDSSGNGGAAVSAYAAAGGMAATIFVPASTSPAKTVQSRAAGAAIELIPGSRQDCADAALRKSAEIFYASHNWHPFFLEGTKTLAYELWEDLGFRAPDHVVIPCGAGSNVLGCWIGFSELLRAGQIARLPRLWAAQPAHCGPIARAALDLPPAEARPTIAEGTAIAQPLRLPECLAGPARQRRRRGPAGGGGDRGGVALARARRRLCRADLRPGGGGLHEAARGGPDRRGRDHRRGADRHRAEIHAALRGDAGSGAVTGLDRLPTPCLLLDLDVLKRNIARMAEAVARHPGVALRPHMKTAKSAQVADLAAPGKGPITVSTLAEARYFADHGFRDQIYAVGIVPAKLDAVAALNAAGGAVKVITDDLDVARAIAAHPGRLEALIEVDVGEGRAGVAPDGEALAAIAAALGPRLAGVLSHSGHSYAGRSEAAMAEIAEAERARLTRAADRLRAAGHPPRIVSAGASPTARYARHLEGVTEMRAGVYMMGDLLQGQIGTHPPEDIAVTVLASVIGRYPGRGAVLLDAGALALSKDRSTEAAPRDWKFGRVLDLEGRPSLGDAMVVRVHQEHGEVQGEDLPLDRLPVGARVRVAPNHVCLTAAAHERYHVLEGGRLVAEWARVNFW
jgi:threonine synthase